MLSPLKRFKEFKEKFLKKETTENSCTAINNCEMVCKDDEEVDGFVLVGMTADEKTTVHANANTDTPPQYHVSAQFVLSISIDTLMLPY